jgi:hypothetical protein
MTEVSVASTKTLAEKWRVENVKMDFLPPIFLPSFRGKQSFPIC